MSKSLKPAGKMVCTKAGDSFYAFVLDTCKWLWAFLQISRDIGQAVIMVGAKITMEWVRLERVSER